MRSRPLKRKSYRQKELEELDELLRRHVLLRDGFKCRRCGARPLSREGGARGVVLQACHIYGKGAYPALRFVPENVITLCRDKCHIGWWHRVGFGREAAPSSVREWCIATLGKAHMDQLDLIAMTWKGKRMDLKLERRLLEQLVGKLGLVL